MLAIYTRLSKEDIDSTSINNQLREGRSFAKDKGFKDIELYNEGEGVSGGAEIKDRPQLFKLLQDFRIDKIKAVWFRNQNRLERNSNTWHIFITDAKKYNIDIYFNDKIFDYDNPQENLFGSINSALNQYNKDLQSAQTKRSLKDNIAEGKVWSVVAYGYKSDNGYLAIEDNEAKIIREIYDLSLTGIGTNSIANRLNDRGVPSRKNKLFRAKTIQGIIKNPIYKGERNYSNQTYDSPIIIEPNLWQKVNDNLVNNRNNSGKKVEHKYLLKGILKCGKCGRNYYGRSRVTLKDNYYLCSSKRHRELNCGNRSINIPFIENLIWGNFFGSGQFKVLLNDYFNKQSSNNPIKEIDLKLNKHRASLKDKKVRKDKFLDLVLDGALSNEDVKSKMMQLKSAIVDIQKKIDNLEDRKVSINQNLCNQENILSELDINTSVSFDDRQNLRMY